MSTDARRPSQRLPMPTITHQTEPRWKFVQDVYLPVYEDPDGPGDQVMYAPPSRVLAVSVVAERCFLSVRKYEEDNKTTTTTSIHDEVVSAEALLNALVLQMGVEFIQGVLRRHEDWSDPTPAKAGEQ